MNIFKQALIKRWVNNKRKRKYTNAKKVRYPNPKKTHREVFEIRYNEQGYNPNKK